MRDNFILISGRPGSGKTELIILYCNKSPDESLILTEESTGELLRLRELSEKVTVIREEEFSHVYLFKYSTICIDYVELFDKDFLYNLIEKASKRKVRIVALTYMKNNFKNTNIFVDLKADRQMKRKEEKNKIVLLTGKLDDDEELLK